MTDWSDKAVGILDRKREEKNLRDQVFLEKQKIIKTLGVRLFGDVRSYIRKHVSALEASRPGILVIQKDLPNEMVVWEIKDGILLRLTFDQGTLFWAIGSTEQEYFDVTVTEDGSVRLRSGIVPTTPDRIAEQMLDALLRT
jgi:hypothetical protein